MTHICHFCQEDVQDGDHITVVVDTLYKKIPSKIAFALNTGEMIAHPDTIAHFACKGKTVGF